MAYETGAVKTCFSCKVETDNWSPKARYCRPCNTEKARAIRYLKGEL